MVKTADMLKANTNRTDINKDIDLGMEKPSNNVLYGAVLGSIVISLAMFPFSRKGAIFTGLWAPTILGLGIMMKENQILKLERQRLAGT